MKKISVVLLTIFSVLFLCFGFSLAEENQKINVTIEECNQVQPFDGLFGDLDATQKIIKRNQECDKLREKLKRVKEIREQLRVEDKATQNFSLSFRY